MNIHLLGTGSVGSLLAFHLQRALAEWAKTAAEAASRLYLHSARAASGSVSSITVETSDGAVETQDGFLAGAASGTDPIDVLLIAVKADQTLSAVAPLIPRLRRSTSTSTAASSSSSPSTVVFLQNGVGQDTAVLERFYPSSSSSSAAPFILLGSNTHGTWRRDKRHVVHAARGTMHFACSRETSQRLAKLQRLADADAELLTPSELIRTGAAETSASAATSTLRETLSLLTGSPALSAALGTSLESSAAFSARALRKLVVNCALNPLTALHGVRNGVLLDAPETRDEVERVVRECTEVLAARRSGDKQQREDQEGEDEEEAAAALWSYDSLLSHVHAVIRSTGPNWSSMVQDVRSGRGATEIDYLNGAIVRWGRELGVPTPCNERLVERVKELVQRKEEAPA